MTLRPVRETPRLTAAARARQDEAVEALAAAIATVAAGEKVRTLEALASVVVNRLRAARARLAPASWGVDLGSAVAAPRLFPAIEHLTRGDERADACRRIAARAAAGSLPDPTGGAVFWHRAGTIRPEDAADGESLRIGGLVFIRAVPRPAPDEQGWSEAGQD